MKEKNQPIIQINNLEQIGMVVENLEEAMESMWQTFGIGPWHVLIFTPKMIKENNHYGKPSKSGMKLAICQMKNIQLELMQPTGNEGIYHDFIKKYGNGIQHVGWHKVKTEQDFFATKTKLENAGMPCIWSGHLPQGRFAYFDTLKKLNTLLEIAWFEPNATTKPNYIYPSLD